MVQRSCCTRHPPLCMRVHERYMGYMRGIMGCMKEYMGCMGARRVHGVHEVKNCQSLILAVKVGAKYTNVKPESVKFWIC